MIRDNERNYIEVNYPRFVKQLIRITNALDMFSNRRHYTSASVILVKEFEDEEKSIYTFGPDDEADGELLFIKREVTTSLIQPVSDCPFTEKYFRVCSGYIFRNWIGAATLPEKVILDTGY